jgi:hypothetical protein
MVDERLPAEGDVQSRAACNRETIMSFVKLAVPLALVLATISGVAHANTRAELEARTRKYVWASESRPVCQDGSSSHGAASYLLRQDGSNKVMVRCLVSNYFSDGQNGGSYACPTFVPLAQ